MNDQGTIERMAEALLIVSQAQLAHRQRENGMLVTSSEMQRWVREVLNDPDEQLAVAVLPHLVARLDQCSTALVKGVPHG